MFKLLKWQICTISITLTGFVLPPLNPQVRLHRAPLPPLLCYMVHQQWITSRPGSRHLATFCPSIHPCTYVCSGVIPGLSVCLSGHSKALRADNSVKSREYQQVNWIRVLKVKYAFTVVRVQYRRARKTFLGNHYIDSYIDCIRCGLWPDGLTVLD